MRCFKKCPVRCYGQVWGAGWEESAFGEAYGGATMASSKVPLRLILNAWW